MLTGLLSKEVGSTNCTDSFHLAGLRTSFTVDNELLGAMEGGPRGQRKRGRENRRTNPKSGAGGESIRENRDVKNASRNSGTFF